MDRYPDYDVADGKGSGAGGRMFDGNGAGQGWDWLGIYGKDHLSPPDGSDPPPPGLYLDETIE